MLKFFIKTEDGNISVFMALCITAIGIVIAAAVEASRAYSVDTKLQDALDNATLYSSSITDIDSFEEDSVSFFEVNFVSNSSLRNQSVSFNIVDDTVVGTASVDMSLFFRGLLNKENMRISAKSKIAIAQNASPCITALSTTRNPGILLNSGARINAPKCGVHVHSVQNPAFTINSGTILNVKETCVSGSQIVNNTGAALPKLETSCSVAPDPYAGAFPVPDSSNCDFSNGNYNEDSLSMSPGVYCGWHNFNNGNADISFAPGTYILKNGGWNVNGGDWTGTGVTFYYADSSKIQFNSAVKANLTAPTSGDYAGVFMTEDPGLSAGNSQFILNDNKGFDFEGVMYLPSREVIFNSGATLRSYKMNLVADSFIFNTTNLQLQSADSSSSDASNVVYIME